jgi:hypothetical protein
MEESISTVNAEPVSTVETQETVQVETNVDSVNADNGEVESTQQIEKPVQSKEENAHFAEQRRAREAAESKAVALERDYFIAKTYGKDYEIYSEGDIAEKYGHLGITTLDQFKEAVRFEEMKEKGIDPDEIKKYVNEDPDVKAAREWKEQQKKNAVYEEFFQYFKEENGRDFDTTKDTIPQEVWDSVNKGKSLVDAYAIHESKQLKAKLKALETNTLNAESSTGSVTGNGTTKETQLTPEMIENMTDKERMSRWKEIKQVLGMK